MGYPLFEQAESSSAPAAAGNCPVDGSGGRTRRFPHSVRAEADPQPSMDELAAPESSWAEWTRSIRRNLRQRAEVYYTNAPSTEQDGEAGKLKHPAKSSP